jgi:hypothetical protein
MSIYDGLSDGEQRLLMSLKRDGAVRYTQIRDFKKRSWDRRERSRLSNQLPSPKPGSYAAIISEME